MKVYLWTFGLVGGIVNVALLYWRAEGIAETAKGVLQVATPVIVGLLTAYMQTRRGITPRRLSIRDGGAAAVISALGSNFVLTLTLGRDGAICDNPPCDYNALFLFMWYGLLTSIMFILGMIGGVVGALAARPPRDLTEAPASGTNRPAER